MTNIANTVAPKSDQMNADDLIAGPRTITITEVKSIGSPKDAQPIAIGYEGDDGKPWKPCKSMRRVLIQAWGDEGSEFVGRSITLFCDKNVMFGGVAVGGIRISHMSHIDDDLTLQLTVSRGQRRPVRVQKLSSPDPVDLTDTLVELREAAALGMADLKTAWEAAWRNTPKHSQAQLKTHLAGLQETANAAEDDGFPGDRA